MAEAEVESLWQRQRLAEAEVKKPHNTFRATVIGTATRIASCFDIR